MFATPWICKRNLSRATPDEEIERKTRERGRGQETRVKKTSRGKEMVARWEPSLIKHKGREGKKSSIRSGLIEENLRWVSFHELDKRQRD